MLGWCCSKWCHCAFVEVLPHKILFSFYNNPYSVFDKFTSLLLSNQTYYFWLVDDKTSKLGWSTSQCYKLFSLFCIIVKNCLVWVKWFTMLAYIALLIYILSQPWQLSGLCPPFLLGQSSVCVRCLFEFEYGRCSVISLGFHVSLSNLFSLSAVCIKSIMTFPCLLAGGSRYWSKDSDFVDCVCGEKANASTKTWSYLLQTDFMKH